MIVEFFGPPAVGKTTIARLFAERTGGVIISISSRKEKYYYILRFVFLRPILFLALVWKTKWEGRRSLSLMWHKLFLLSEHISYTEKALSYSHDTLVLLDGGLLQYALSLYEHRISKSTAERYLKNFMFSDTVIVLTGDTAVCERRMRERGRMPREHLPINHKKWLFLVNMNTNCFTKILQTMEKTHVYNTVEVNTQTIVTLVSKVIQS